MATYIDNSSLMRAAAVAAAQQQQQQSAPTPARDPTWLQVEVCREYLRQACRRDNTECKYAHPSSNVDIQNGKVTVCFDAFKDRCTRSNCKYFHAPAQMKADLEMRGKMSLLKQKSEQIALQNNSAAQLALFQLNPLLNPFMQNSGANSAAAAQISQYQQLLQQQNYMAQLSAHQAAQAANGLDGGHTSPIETSPSPPRTTSSIEVCREFQRNSCPRSEGECRFAHPEPNVQIECDNRVTVCMDFVKSASCSRAEKCKYFHPPQHLQEKLKNGTLAGCTQQLSPATLHNNNNINLNGASCFQYPTLSTPASSSAAAVAAAAAGNSAAANALAMNQSLAIAQAAAAVAAANNNQDATRIVGDLKRPAASGDFGYGSAAPGDLLLQGYGGLLPNYGKMLRLDNSANGSLNGKCGLGMTSSAVANQNAAAAMYSQYAAAVSAAQQPTAIFYNPLYQAQLAQAGAMPQSSTLLSNPGAVAGNNQQLFAAAAAAASPALFTATAAGRSAYG
jgi:muscleblind protein